MPATTKAIRIKRRNARKRCPQCSALMSFAGPCKRCEKKAKAEEERGITMPEEAPTTPDPAAPESVEPVATTTATGPVTEVTTPAPVAPEPAGPSAADDPSFNVVPPPGPESKTFFVVVCGNREIFEGWMADAAQQPEDCLYAYSVDDLSRIPEGRPVRLLKAKFWRRHGNSRNVIAAMAKRGTTPG